MMKLNGVNGVLIDYPTKFLDEEWFHPSTLAFGMAGFMYDKISIAYGPVT